MKKLFFIGNNIAILGKQMKIATLCALFLVAGTGAAVASPEMQQSKIRVAGTVVDRTGEPVIGANIVEKGDAANGTITDVDGNFSLQVNAGATLTVSYIGYVAQEVAVGNRTQIDITLQEDTQALDEVVVVGYGTQKKANLSGAVATIPARALENRVVSNANIALQGLSPNVNITRTSGRASAAPDINIRGFTSINGGSAFILVDNVPMTAAELARINPSDIESVSILKDASAAAIYGARAAFGVVLVTTKTARSEKIQIDVDYSYGAKQFDNLPEPLVDIPEYMILANIMTEQSPIRFNDAAIEYARRRMSDRSLPEILGPGRENGGVNDRLINDGEWEYYGIYNWFDVMLRDFSPSHTTNVRIAQKSDRLSYAASAGYYNEGGMLSYGVDDFQRFNFRGNATYNLLDRWTLGSNIAFNRSDYKNTLDTGEGDFWFYRLHSNYPTQPIFNPDGSYTQDGGNNVGSAVAGGKNAEIVDELQLSFNTKFDILKDVWSVSADFTHKTVNRNVDRLSISTGGYYRNKPSSDPFTLGDSHITDERNFDRLTTFNLYTNFNKTFGDRHFAGATFGYNQEHYIYNNTGLSGGGLITESLPTIQLTKHSLTRWQSIEEQALRGVFGRLNYVFDNRYILEASGRYDGSSRFPKGDRFGFFPSGSAAWVLSREGFMDGVDESLRLSNLKLRGSYGTLGNQIIMSGSSQVYYPYISTMGYGNNINPIIEGDRPPFISAPGATTGGLTWETVRTVDGGIDLGFLDNRLDITADIYTRYTENMLTKSRTLPGVFGAGEPRANAADLKTKGWELTAGWRDALKDAGGAPLSYSVRFMLADSRTWITRFDNPNKNLYDYYEGQELGELWGYTVLGYFNSNEEVAAWANQDALMNGGRVSQAGDVKFADLNNDGKIDRGNQTVDNHGDIKVIGNRRERFPYSADLSAEWKGVDLRLFFQGVGKRDAYSGNREDYIGGSSNAQIFFWGLYGPVWANGNTRNLDRWTEENPSQDAFFPRAKPSIGQYGELSYANTKYMQDASYLRLKNVTLGYTIPAQLTDRWRMRSLRVFFAGENLFTFHHIQVKGNDPENFGNAIYYPLQRTFSFGLSLGL